MRDFSKGTVQCDGYAAYPLLCQRAGRGIYTLIESCRRRGIDPYAYLKDVLTRLPAMTNHQIPEVTPAAWAKARRQRQQPAAA
jgi:hypothetical protein